MVPDVPKARIAHISGSVGRECKYYNPKPDVSKARIAHISGSLGRECEGNTILRNVGNHSSKDTASHSTRPGFSIVPL